MTTQPLKMIIKIGQEEIKKAVEQYMKSKLERSIPAVHRCSRNIDLALDYDHKFNGTAYWDYCLQHDMEDILKTLGGTISLQGELFGEGIQGNKYKLKGLHYRVYNFWDMTNHCYLEQEVMKDTVEAFGLGPDFLVPQLGQITLNHSVSDLLSMATGKSTISDVLREGLVSEAYQNKLISKLAACPLKRLVQSSY